MSPIKPDTRTLIADFIAGLTTGIANIPDAMASAILAGANPVYGLYALMVGTPVGGLLTSSHFLSVSATSAMALTAGSALAVYRAQEYALALFTLTILVGVVMVLAGVFQVARLMRFVSNAVMVGFLTGVSVLVVLSQLGDFSGYSSQYGNKVRQTVDLLLHLDQVQAQTLVIGLLTVVIILVVDRTRARNFSMLIGMVLASLAAVVFGWDMVAQVGDVAQIPSGLPRPVLPDLTLLGELALPAVSIAIIGLVQGAGVSKAYPNPDGRYPNITRDFIGQGAANLAAGFFQGMPLGGSVGSTALNVSAGARSRWANVFSGLVVVIMVLLFSRGVSLVAIPAMAALLIVAGIQSVKVEEFLDVWDVGLLPRLVMLVTFIATLALPVQYAVLIGVLLSGLIYFAVSSVDVRLKELQPLPDGLYLEKTAPKSLPSHAVTILQVYGNLFYASIERLGEMLPAVQGAERPVVILRLRQHSQISSTFINLLERYHAELDAVGGKLILAGVSPRIKEQLDKTETTGDVLGEEDIFHLTEILGESMRAAVLAAQSWLDLQDARDDKS